MPQSRIFCSWGPAVATVSPILKKKKKRRAFGRDKYLLDKAEGVWGGETSDFLWGRSWKIAFSGETGGKRGGTLQAEQLTRFKGLFWGKKTSDELKRCCWKQHPSAFYWAD